MPPAAPSCLSAYLPKICRNIGSHYRCLLAPPMLVCGCGQAPLAEVFEVRAHWLRACSPTEEPAATIDLEALGDFEASALTSETLSEEGSRTTLVFPPDTRAVTARASTGFQTFHGTGAFDDNGVLDVALWPTEQSCTLLARTAKESDYPGHGGGQMFGYSPELGSLLLAGGTEALAAGALVVSVGTGRVFRTEGMNRRRTRATVTPFGSGFLIAGGEDPVAAEEPDELVYQPHDTAEVFDPVRRTFTEIDLDEPRSRHAAVVLDSGETVLIGGQTEGGGALRSLVSIDPVTRAHRVDELATLNVARINPTALQLDDGRILVAGGEDARGNPVELLEWLSADARTVVGNSDEIETRSDRSPMLGRAFTSMPAGAALTVGGCEAGQDPCVPSTVLWISSDGQVADAVDLGSDPNDAAAGIEHPILVPAADGSPWLFGNDAMGSPVRQRFDPWEARFETPLFPPPVTLGPDAPPPIAIDPGLIVWLDADGALRGFRDNLRGPFTRDAGPLGLGDPSHLAPNQRPPVDGETPCDGIAFENGELCLTSAYMVAITDTSYLDVSLEIDVREGPPPVVRLNNDESFGGGDCEWPGAIPSGGGSFVFSRTGSIAALTLDGDRRECRASPERARVYVTTEGDGEMRIVSIRVRRSGAEAN